jgi:hypothetical protein
MSLRFASIVLPPEEDLCEPQGRCMCKLSCARRLASATGHAEPRDWSGTEGGGSALCDGFLDLRVALPRTWRGRGES